MIGVVIAVVALVFTVVERSVALRSERRMRFEQEKELRKAERARVEAERTAASLAIVALVRKLDEHQILTSETDLGEFYGSPTPMLSSAKSIRDELLKVENTLRKAESVLGESYEYDIASLQKMGESCKNFLRVLERLALIEDFTFGGQNFYNEIDGPHSDFIAIFETEIEQLAERNGIQRRYSA